MKILLSGRLNLQITKITCSLVLPTIKVKLDHVSESAVSKMFLRKQVNI